MKTRDKNATYGGRDKPCKVLKYCPYGSLVESFPLKKKPIKRSCGVFSHDCPVFSMAGPHYERKEVRTR